MPATASLRRWRLLAQCCSKLATPQQVTLHTCTTAGQDCGQPGAGACAQGPGPGAEAGARLKRSDRALQTQFKF